MDAAKKNIGQIIENSRILRIPFFQRKYVWEDDMWTEFLDTMVAISSKNQESEYFMGSIILKKIDTSLMDNKGYGIGSVIDGQQRLITLFLFFKALCDKQNRQEYFKNAFFVIDFEGKYKIGLEASNEDKEIFDGIIENKITVAEKESSNPYSRNKIYQCHKFFTKKDLDNIEIRKIYALVRFVVIELEEKEDEQQVFDTINSLGVTLTTAELVKNYLFENDEVGKSEHDKYWKESFENDMASFWERSITAGRQKKTNIDLFFQAFFDVYIAIWNKNKNDKEKFISKSGSLSKNYRNFFVKIDIKKNKDARIEFLENLQNYAKIYADNIDKDLIKGNIESNIQKINVIVFLLNTTTFVFYILYIIKNSPDTEEGKGKLFGLIVNYIMRRVVCKASTKSYTNIFNALINQGCDTYKKLNKWMRETREPTNIFPSDEELKKGFNENKISNNSARVILYFIEKFLRKDGKDALTLRPINGYEIEHVMPKEWKKNWGDDLSNDEKYKRDEYVNKIGNFTLVTESLNKILTNKDWDAKKTGYGKNKGLLEYSKGFKTFDKYMQEEEWNEQVIDVRSNFLYEEGKKLWSLPLNPSEIT